MAGRDYTLVLWVSGEDKDKNTVLRSSWIKDFGSSSVGEDVKSYVVEWMSSKIKPVGGWKCYDAIILTTSGRNL